jgi:glycosyltransferase involved in cell wall biosynthesis
MKILIVIPYFYPSLSFGGPVKVAFEEAKELVRRGHEVVVFASDAENMDKRLNMETDVVEGIQVYYFKNLSMKLVRWSKLFITPDLGKKMKKELKSFDVIHAHEYTTYQNIIVHKYAKKFGVPYILEVHGSLPKFGRVLRKYFFDFLFGTSILKDASKVVALSTTEAEQYKASGVPADKIEIIPNGLNVSDYADAGKKGFFAKTFGVAEDTKIILYLGRIHKTKGLDCLIRAYAQTLKQGGDTKLVIAGPDDGYLSEIQSLAKSLGVYDAIVFTGFLSENDKIAALIDAAVFVTPSFYGFPMTFLEACAVGTPIVTTTLGDPLDWINNNVGYVSSPEPEDLANAINKILFHNDIREKFSRNGKNLVSSEFSVAHMVDRLQHVFEEIVS